MKLNVYLKAVFVCILLVSVYSCETDDSQEEEQTIPEIDNQIVFWSDFQGPPIEVSVSNNLAGTISAINSSPPGCGTTGNVTLTLNPGNYNFSAEETSDPFRSWSGSFTIESDVSCLNYLLFAN